MTTYGPTKPHSGQLYGTDWPRQWVHLPTMTLPQLGHLKLAFPCSVRGIPQDMHLDATSMWFTAPL